MHVNEKRLKEHESLQNSSMHANEKGKPLRSALSLVGYQFNSKRIARASFQGISRFVSQDRNFGLSYIALTQRLASVDSNLVEISGLKYFGKTEGDNNRRKAKAWLPKEYLDKAKDLKTGMHAK